MRLIDGDALIKQLLSEIQADTDKSIQATLAKNIGMIFCKVIEKQPTIEERKTGYWIEDKEASRIHVEKIYRCSACNNFEAWGTTELYRFCPNCGAAMRGVKHE